MAQGRMPGSACFRYLCILDHFDARDLELQITQAKLESINLHPRIQGWHQHPRCRDSASKTRLAKDSSNTMPNHVHSQQLRGFGGNVYMFFEYLYVVRIHFACLEQCIALRPFIGACLSSNCPSAFLQARLQGHWTRVRQRLTDGQGASSDRAFLRVGRLKVPI